MGLNGYIKLHRKLIEWGWYSDHVVKDVFLHILMTAVFKDGSYRGYELHPGDAIIGRKKMAVELGFSEQQIRTALKKLESTGEIMLKSTNRFTIATVKNWEFYQGDNGDSLENLNVSLNKSLGGSSQNLHTNSTNKTEGEDVEIANDVDDCMSTDNQQITNNQPTDNQQITTSEECKEFKNVKNVKNIIHPPLTPPSGATPIRSVESLLTEEEMNKLFDLFDDSQLINLFRQVNENLHGDVTGIKSAFRYVLAAADRAGTKRK